MKKSFYITIIIFIPSFLFAQSPGSNVFSYPGIHDLYLTFTQQNFWDSLQIYKDEGDITGEYTYMPATINLDGTVMDSVGVRLKGNSSYMTPGIKKSIKLDFNEFVSGQKLDGLKKVNLNNNFNDPTLMRENLFLDVLGNIGVNAPRCVYTRVYINNVYWGLYNMADHVDKVFLKSRYYVDTGNLYKGDKEPWMTCANLSYHPDPMEYRNCYTLETNEDIDDWSDLVNLIDVINNTPPSIYNSSLKDVLNTTSFIDAWAANIVFVNVDSYVETGHNYYIYHNPVNDKFEWISWDVNEAFGLWNVGMPLDQLYNLDIFYMPGNPQFDRPLTYYMLQDSLFRKQYTDKLYELVCNEFKPSKLFPKIDSLYNLIRTDVYADTNKIIGNTFFEENIDNDVEIQGYPGWVPGLKKFVQDRRDTLISQLEAIGYVFSGIDRIGKTTTELHIFPNPAADHVNIGLPGKYISAGNVAIFSSTGELLKSFSYKSGSSIEIDCSGFPAGLFFVKITGEGKSYAGKFIRQ